MQTEDCMDCLAVIFEVRYDFVFFYSHIRGHTNHRGGGLHIWDLPVLRYHKIMVIYPYPFLVVITQLFSYIIFINNLYMYINWFTRINILMIIYVILNNGGNENSPYFLNVMVNYHYHSENRVITR